MQNRILAPTGRDLQAKEEVIATERNTTENNTDSKEECMLCYDEGCEACTEKDRNPIDYGEWEIKSKRFRNKKTGEIVTQFSILDIADFEEVQE